MEANTPTPSRIARKPILPRASSARGGLMPRSPAHLKPSGAVSGRSEPWRRTHNPLAHSAKAHRSQSLLSEQRPDTAEPCPPKPQRSGVRPQRALEANTPNPLAHSAKANPPQSLLSERRPDTAEPRYAAFLQNASVLALPYPGFHPGLVCRAPLGHPNGVSVRPRGAQLKPQRSGVRPERALEANTPNPLAHSAKAHRSQSLLSERRPDTAKPRDKAPHLEFPPERP